MSHTSRVQDYESSLSERCKELEEEVVKLKEELRRTEADDYSSLKQLDRENAFLRKALFNLADVGVEFYGMDMGDAGIAALELARKALGEETP